MINFKMCHFKFDLMLFQCYLTVEFMSLCGIVFQVCCSGHGKNGAVCVLQQSIRPESITQVHPHKFAVVCIMTHIAFNS